MTKWAKYETARYKAIRFHNTTTETRKNNARESWNIVKSPTGANKQRYDVNSLKVGDYH